MSKYTKEQLRTVFQRPFDKETWKTILIDIFRANNVRVEPEKFTDPGQSETGWYMGNIETPDNYRIGLFFYRINSGSVAHKKVGLRNLVKSWVNPNWGEFDAAVVVFNDGADWRLSFVCDIKDVATSPKRFTFVFGEKDNFYRTPIERFTTLQNEEPSFKNIHKAFSVEALSDDFFDQYRDHYADFVEFITGKRYVKDGSKWVERVIHKPNYQYSDTFGCDDKLVRDYIKKMFGRIVFLYFLQRKGWLDGNRNYMHDLFVYSDKKDDFLDGVLEPLFFEILNTDKPYRTAAAKALPGSNNIPYLNGGLFAADEIDELDCKFPEYLFSKFFDFLDSYNFTIDENDTDDAEIGINPEMLGRIFENLLEDNKDKGAFYTPKEIVDYMCRESIIAYLQNERFTDSGNETIRKFVDTYDGTSLSVEQRKYLKDKLKSVKICDPAIGSGAFPMGLVNLLSKLYSALRLSTDAGVIKRHIMEQNIYGVDIEKGAVDIARLRFWLAMIVEEKDPIPLPNLHFKIMQGNSLLESYQGVDLSDMTNVMPKTRNLFDSKDSERESLVADLKKYYETSNHIERDRLFNDIIKNVRRQLLAKNITLPQGMDPSANEDFFLWHTWFSDVFENGGFDIVIGNPPYIDSETMTKNSPELRSIYASQYLFAKGNWDIYILFYELGLRMLSKTGYLNYIVPNKWLSIGYGKILREVAYDKIKTICDCRGVKVFEAGNEPIISLLGSCQCDNITIGRIQQGKHIIHIADIDKRLVDTNNIGICIANSIALLAKIKKQKYKVSDLATVENPFSTAEAYNLIPLICENPHAQSYKLINTGTIDPYINLWGRSQTAYLKNKFNFPQVDELRFQQNFPRRVRQVKSEKIIISGMRHFESFFDINGEYVAGKSTIIVLNPKENDALYILQGIFNSKLLKFYIYQAYSALGIGGGINFSKDLVAALPIPELPQNHSFVSIVKEIVKLKSINPDADVLHLTNELDEFVYHLYELSYDDVLIIDPETTITREEYENYE